MLVDQIMLQIIVKKKVRKVIVHVNLLLLCVVSLEVKAQANALEYGV